MLEVTMVDDGVVRLAGRFDASQVATADDVLGRVSGPTTLDFAELEYISSAGIGIVLKTYKRLHASGHTLRITNMRQGIRNIFHVAGLDRVLEIA